MRFFRDLIIATLAALALILALEVGLRLAQDRFEASLYQAEPERGYSLRPNAQGWNILDGEAYIRVNSDGLRGGEERVQRPAHTLRLAVVGSSEAAAFEVPLELTSEVAIERKLAPVFEPHGNRLEVLNFGVPGYTLSQQYLTLKNHVWKYDPQVVVLFWNQGNLLKNTKETYSGGAQQPFYVLRNGQLEPAEPAPAMPSPGSWNFRKAALKNRLADLMNSSFLLCMLRQASVELQNQMHALSAAWRRNFGRPASAVSRLPPDFVQWWPDLPYLPDMQDDWKIGEAFLLEMKKDCDRHGADLQVVIVDEQMQSHPDLAARKAFMQLRGVPSLDASDKRLEQFGEANGIGVFALAPPMGEYAVAHNVALHGEGSDNAGHWNQLGHRIVGGLISNALLTQSPVVRAWAAGRE